MKYFIIVCRSRVVAVKRRLGVFYTRSREGMKKALLFSRACLWNLSMNADGGSLFSAVGSDAGDIFNTLYCFHLFYQRGKLTVVGDTDNEIPLEDAVVRIDGYIAQHHVGFL